MTDLQKELDRAFAVLSTIPVSGDNVDRMMMVRESLRKAYQLAGKDTQAAACEKAVQEVADAAREAANNG